MMTPRKVSNPQVKSGKLRALAITSAERNPGAPDIPTMAEAGLPGVEGGAWFGLAAPARTPRPVVEWLNRETRRGTRQDAPARVFSYPLPCRARSKNITSAP